MVTMLLKMSAMTAFYVLLTVLLWLKLRNGKLSLPMQFGVGIIYGLCCVMSTHFGVDYGSMMLNVRDLGPLLAGLFFHPLSGVISGLIGGIERYIAGTYWGVGSYTTVACSVSTCLAGAFAALLSTNIFKRRKPGMMYAFSVGAVMEVFHMYAILITHREDMRKAYALVRVCAIPMILFTGIGMAISSVALLSMSGEWDNPFKRHRAEEITVSRRLQRWLLSVTLALFALNFVFLFGVHTQRAIQNAHSTLDNVIEDVRMTYQTIRKTQEGIDRFGEAEALADARAIALSIEKAGGLNAVSSRFMEVMRRIHGLYYLSATSLDGDTLDATGNGWIQSKALESKLDQAFENALNRNTNHQAVTFKLTDSLIAASAGFNDGMIMAAIDTDSLESIFSLAGLETALSNYHVGNEGTLDIIRRSGIITIGNHKGSALTVSDLTVLHEQARETYFTTRLFGVESMCMMVDLEPDLTLLTALPVSEVYSYRSAMNYETAFADILLLASVYILISILVQQIVVDKLGLVNASLAKITGGDLDVVVDVRSSSEFASLSNDINHTVDALKGYIDAAAKRMEEEMELARTIQESAMPRNFNSARDDFEIYAIMQPAKEVGGDFYDFFFVDADKMVLIIADVSGKGIPGAMFMMRSKTALRSMVGAGNSAAEILFKANNALCEGNDAEMFVTVWIGVIDLATGLMQCANAGHEYPILLRYGGDYELLRDKHSLALAAMENVRTRQYEIQLNPGDRLFLYTDGAPEAIDENMEQYGTRRLLYRLNEIRDWSMKDTLPAVKRDISDFIGSAEQFDDITMLGFTYFGKRP